MSECDDILFILKSALHMEERFSILMSLYYKEKPEYAKECFDSLLGQTAKADEWVIVEDGILTEEMYKLLSEYETSNPGLIKRVKLEKSQGLGVALSVGILACSFELIARMDTDDIARNDRFEKQLIEFKNDINLDICGSNIDEFEDDITHIVAHRHVPLSDIEIKKYQKKRDAFNHMTVMYKKSSVLSAGNYQSCSLMEDTYLWVRMMQKGCRCMNIRESLVFVRIGKDMYKRRGGWSYFLKYREGRKKVFETGYIGKLDYFITIIIQFIISLLPIRFRGWIFKNILHR